MAGTWELRPGQRPRAASLLRPLSPDPERESPARSVGGVAGAATPDARPPCQPALWEAVVTADSQGGKALPRLTSNPNKEDLANQFVHFKPM